MLLFSHCENIKNVIFTLNMTLRRLMQGVRRGSKDKYTSTCEENFQKLRKCNKQKIQCFQCYGIYFTREK